MREAKQPTESKDLDAAGSGCDSAKHFRAARTSAVRMPGSASADRRKRGVLRLMGIAQSATPISLRMTVVVLCEAFTPIRMTVVVICER